MTFWIGVFIAWIIVVAFVIIRIRNKNKKEQIKRYYAIFYETSDGSNWGWGCSGIDSLENQFLNYKLFTENIMKADAKIKVVKINSLFKFETQSDYENFFKNYNG